MDTSAQASLTVDHRFGEHERMVEAEAKRFMTGNRELASNTLNYFLAQALNSRKRKALGLPIFL